VTAQDALRKLIAEEDAGDGAGAGDVNDELCVAMTAVAMTRMKSWREMVSIAMAWVVDMMNCDYFGSFGKPYVRRGDKYMNNDDGAWILFEGKVYLLSNLMY